jgi:quinol monooxygenase YgiN
MRTVIVRYKVKPDRADENEGLVRAVYDELAEAQPGGLRYATLRLDDGVSFVHLAEMEDGANPLTEVAAFQRFSENVRERCDEPPVVTDVKVVGSFKLFEAGT